MGTILVVAEIQKGAIREASYELVAVARGLAESGGHDVNGLVIGSGVGDLASEFAGKGAGKTLVVDDAAGEDIRDSPLSLRENRRNRNNPRATRC